MTYVCFVVLAVGLFFLVRFLVDQFFYLKDAKKALVFLRQPHLWNDKDSPVSVWGDLLFDLNRWDACPGEDLSVTRINPARIGTSQEEIRGFEKAAYRFQMSEWLKNMRAGNAFTGEFLHELKAHGLTMEELGTSEQEFIELRLLCATNFIKGYLVDLEKTRDPLCFIGMLSGLRDEGVSMEKILSRLTPEERHAIESSHIFDVAQEIVH